MVDFMIKYNFLLIFCLVFAMSGCAGNKMALTKGKSKIDLTKKSIALLSVRISNQDKPNRQLELQNVIICPQSETNCKHDLPSHYESPYKPYKKEKNHFNEYLLSYELKSGTYNIDGLYTTYRIPTLTAGFGFAKLNFKTEIKPNSISYLGHLDIVLRKKKSDAEISAGGNVPYIDQSIAGFSSGTFDVVVEDKFDEDMKSFISEYPALQKVKVEKSIFPQALFLRLRCLLLLKKLLLLPRSLIFSHPFLPIINLNLTVRNQIGWNFIPERWVMLLHIKK